MWIEHIAIWADELEKLKDFYRKYFNAKAGDKYINQDKNFESYFLSFEQGCRLEIMHQPSIPENKNDTVEQYRGLIHFAISVGNKSKVLELTDELREDGYEIIGEPRRTGDGYFESVILDPEGNRVEITA